MQQKHLDYFKNLADALDRLKEMLDKPIDPERGFMDASIHRFEFCFELFWKNMKNILEIEGREAVTPKQALTLAYELKWIDDEALWRNMLEDRNLTSHTYKKVTADLIYSHLKEYYPEMKRVYELLKSKYFKELL